jgi:protein TonB
MMARDDYDARRWKDEVADTREDLASSRAVVLSAVNDAQSPSSAPQNNSVAANNTPPITDAAFKQPAVDTSKPADKTLASNANQSMQVPATGEPKLEQKAEPKKELPTLQLPVQTEGPRTRVVDNKPIMQVPIRPSTEGAMAQIKETQTAATVTGGPLDVGSLLAYATKQTQPVYPAAAKTMRTTGIVKVEVTIDENGNVASVQNASGPFLLQDAAKDAIRKWRFRPFTRDGQAVKATGFVSFNFAL